MKKVACIRRADAGLACRTEYGSHSAFWPALAAVWEVEAARLGNDEQASIPAVLALAAFLLSLCMQAPQNQLQAVCVQLSASKGSH